ncbi:LysM peptidoglycan-binding domain-containing protein [Terrabacter sp. NPDC000476]|uniref:LysM peptidoglycan-binding domain-containing protein n=1 Tax=Terrabacter sp. NPDC000476 TaxID=3154258 RepID=UPI00331F3527
MTLETERSARRRVRLIGLAAVAGLTAIVVGLPAALLAVGADLIPDTPPSAGHVWAALTSPDDGSLVLGVLTIVGWAVWPFVAGSIVLEVISRLRGVRAPRLPGLALPQVAARNLVSAALLLFITAPVGAQPAKAATIARSPSVVAAAVEIPAGAYPHSNGRPQVGHSAPAATDVAAAERDNLTSGRGTHRGSTSPGPTHTVKRGESLWSIAEQRLGSGGRFGEIAALNTDVLGDKPGFLTPGTVLVLPKEAATADASHTVEVGRGDTLSQIAQEQLGDASRYTEIFEASKDTRQADGARLTDPDLIQPGWSLTMPSAAEEESRALESHRRADDARAEAVIVQPGDTLSDVAQEQLGDASRYPEIFAASTNTRQADGARMRDPDLIRPGWILSIPVPQEPVIPPGPAEPAPSAERRGPLRAAPEPGDPPPPSSSAQERNDVAGSTVTAAEGPTPAIQRPTRPAERSRATSGSAQTSTPGASIKEPSVTDPQGDVPAPWMLAGLSGAGALLAGSMLLSLRRRRAAQLRARRPGRTIATPEPALAPVEKSIIAAGGTSAPTVDYVDGLLRRLASAHTRAGGAVPQLAAVELTASTIRLHLAAPAALAAPWQGTPDQLHWTLPNGTPLGKVGPAVPDQPAPYPLLVTIGASDTGDAWLLNLEDLNVSITGDIDFSHDLARYLLAEIACNPWSHGVRVDLIGVGTEVAAMNPDRLRVHAGGDPAAQVLAEAIATLDRAHDLGDDVPTARAAQAGADAWPARLLVLDSVAHAAATPALTQLLDLIHTHAGRTGTGVVVCGDLTSTGTGSPATPMEITVTADGRVLLPGVGLDLVAVGLTPDEAQGCAALLAQSEDLDDIPIPTPGDAAEGWRSWSNEAGAIRDEHTMPRSVDGQSLDEPVTTVLDRDDEEYLRDGATTREDLQALAPKVTTQVSDAVLAADPTLDADLAAWWSNDCRQPRLTLLGPVSARTRGTALTKRKSYFTEMLTYLATRPHGATPAELADTFNITQAKARDYIRILRDWLGVNPRTGDKHLPDARKAPAALARGVGVYQVVDVLVDADLFRRLRVRGTARGPAGIKDLDAALRLVQGQPFSSLKEDRWYWLVDGDRIDQHLLCAIVDVAHLVTTHSLRSGDLRRARLAAETAALAAPDEEIPRLDLAAIAEAEGRHAKADRILREDVLNRSDGEGAPPELSDRTRQVIAGKDWLERTRHAS